MAPGVRGSCGDADSRREAIHIHELSASPRLRVNRLPGSRLTSITYIREDSQTFANIPRHSRGSTDIRECSRTSTNIHGHPRACVDPREYPLHPLESILHPREDRLDPRECLRATLECRKPPRESISHTREATCGQKLDTLHIREGSKTTFEDVHGHSRGSTDIREDARNIREDARIFARMHGSSRMIPDILDSRQTIFPRVQD